MIRSFVFVSLALLPVQVLAHPVSEAGFLHYLLEADHLLVALLVSALVVKCGQALIPSLMKKKDKENR